MKPYCDINIVLISAATVLLTTSNYYNGNAGNNNIIPMASAYMSPPKQIQIHSRGSINYKSSSSYQSINSIIRNTQHPTPNQYQHRQRLDTLELYSQQTPRRKNNNQESWSKRASIITDNNADVTTTNTSQRSESRFGVRRRVRKVLEKAKRRTGIRNSSEDLYNLSAKSSSSSSSASRGSDRPSEFSSTATTISEPSTLFTPSYSSSSSTSTPTVSPTTTSSTTPSASISPPSTPIKIQSTSTTASVSATVPQAPPRTIKTTSTVTNVVADAASIGGLGAVVVDDKSGKIDVAFDYVAPPPTSTSTTAATTTTSTTEVAKKKVNNERTTPSDGEKQKNEEKDVSMDTTAAKATTGTATKASSEEKVNSTKVSTSTTTPTVKKTSPASTYSPSLIQPKPEPEDILVPAKPIATKNEKTSIPEVDALKGDVSAAFSMPPPPLPFTLPNLTPEQYKLLMDGERVQFQSDMGREGSGFIAVDVKAPASVIWECLLDFYSYPETIPTVRDIQMFTNTHLAQDYYAETAVDKQKYEDGTLATLKHGIPSVTRAAFTLSKFRLKIAAIHKYRTHPQGDYMIFTLDPACTNVVLQSAKGVWHTQSNPDGRGEEYTRVWLLCELKVSPFLPKWIVDYAAKKAMPRASSWIKPHCEAAAELWYKELDKQ